MAGNGPLPSGLYSVAMRLTFRSPKRPLSVRGTVTSVPAGCARASGIAPARRSAATRRTARTLAGLGAARLEAVDRPDIVEQLHTPEGVPSRQRLEVG